MGRISLAQLFIYSFGENHVHFLLILKSQYRHLIGRDKTALNDKVINDQSEARSLTNQNSLSIFNFILLPWGHWSEETTDNVTNVTADPKNCIL